MGKKIQWLSILQGWAMLMVVIGHANMWEFYKGGTVAEYDWLHKFVYCFHMPLFMFVSGGLFYKTRIFKNWNTKDVYKDKFFRLFIPFFVFTLIAFFIKCILSGFVKRSVSFSFVDILNAFWSPGTGPIIEMWFIGTLLWLMLLYPVYKYIMRNKVLEIMLVCVFFATLLFKVKLPIGGGFINLNGIFSFGFYFVLGMVFFKYQWEKYLNNKIILIGLSIVWAVLYYLFGKVHILTPLIGCAWSISFALFVDKYKPNLFKTFRSYTFQIFLIGLYPQMFIELFIWQKYQSVYLIVPCYIISILLALYCPVLISKIVKKIDYKWLNLAIGLK